VADGLHLRQRPNEPNNIFIRQLAVTVRERVQPPLARPSRVVCHQRFRARTEEEDRPAPGRVRRVPDSTCHDSRDSAQASRSSPC